MDSVTTGLLIRNLEAEVAFYVKLMTLHIWPKELNISLTKVISEKQKTLEWLKKETHK